jgi:SpoVK/Ycf46/Vps4 family AAA+-type ATPase
MAPENNLLNGLFITPQKMNLLMNGQSVANDWFDLSIQTHRHDPEIELINKAIDIQKNNIRIRIKDSLQKGVDLTLFNIKQLFGLNDEEYLILNICLAIQVFPQYEKVFTYLHDNASRKLPSIDLVLNILHSTFENKISSKDYFSFKEPLLANNLIELINDPYEKNNPSSIRQFRINDRIYNYICNIKGEQKELANLIQVLEIDKFSQYLSSIYDDDHSKKIRHFIENNMGSFMNNDQSYAFYFYGPYGSGKNETAISIAQLLNKPLINIDMNRVCASSSKKDNDFELMIRESVLLNAIMYFFNIEIIFENQDNLVIKKIFFDTLSNYSRLTIIASNRKFDIRSEFENKQLYEIDFEVPGYHKRQMYWQNYLNQRSIIEDYQISENVNIQYLAGKFKFTKGQIKDAIKAALTSAKWKSDNQKVIHEQELFQGCHLQSNQELQSLAKKITTHYTLDDIILPEDQKNQIDEIIQCVKNKNIVYDEMGFGNKMSYGRGLNILFSGLSGTGKTMASAIIANTLNLEIFEINISQILSKFVGETEKRIADIFNSARNAVIFFDEADALFGKRTKIKDAHDKYANIETSFLLREIEKYEEGCVLLATNRKDNVDEAFTRRMDFIVDFPFPNTQDRLKIWHNIFPEETRIDTNIDFDFLAEKFNLSGGNIQNAAIASAFYASQNDKIITMKHIIKAIKREYQKMNKLCNKSSFGDYYEL